MKSLENVTGLQEMNLEEMNEINGGGWSDWLTAIDYGIQGARLWIKYQSKALASLGSDAQFAAMQYN
jgi:hypothetical protein